MKLSARDRVLVCGMTRHGKSFFARAMAQANARFFRRVVFFDVDTEYRGEGQVVTTLQLARKPELLDEKNVRLVVRPVGESRAELARDVDFLMRLVRSKSSATRTTLLVLEEPGRWAAGVTELLDEASISWAKRGVALVFVSQRANLVPKTSRTQLSKIISFRQTEPSDLDALEERAGKEFRARVQALPRFEHADWTDDEAPTNQSKELHQ